MICCALDMKFWPEVKPLIEEALLGDDRLTIEEIKKELDENTMQLWGIHDGILRAVMVTTMVDYLNVRAVRVVTVTGKDCEQWLDVLIHTISEWGGEHGAHILEFTGRKGWEKVLTKYGWGDTRISMSKTI